MSRGNKEFNLSVLESADIDNDGVFTNSSIESIEDLNETPVTEVTKTSESEKKTPTLKTTTTNPTIKTKKTEDESSEDEEDTEDFQEIDSIEDLDKAIKKAKNKSEDTEEEVEEEAKTTKSELPKAPNTKTAKNTNALKVFTENLAEQGIVDFNEEEFNKSEDKDTYLQTKVAERIAKGAEELYNEKIGELPEEIETLVDLYKKGVPLHTILEADKKVAQFEEITPEVLSENEDLQKSLLKELLETQGISKEKIQAKIKRYEDLGTLKDEAEEALDALKTYEKANKEQEILEAQNAAKDREERFKERVKKIENDINSKTEILGQTLTKEQKKTLIDGILKPVGKDKEGRAYNAIRKAAMEDPEYDLKVAYFTLILKGDLSKLSKKAETKAVKKLTSVIDEDNLEGGTTGDTETTPKGFDMDVMKNALNYLKRKK